MYTHTLYLIIILGWLGKILHTMIFTGIMATLIITLMLIPTALPVALLSLALLNLFTSRKEYTNYLNIRHANKNLHTSTQLLISKYILPIKNLNITHLRYITTFPSTWTLNLNAKRKLLYLSYFDTLVDLAYFTRRVITMTCGFSFYYLQGLVFILFIDACLTDDEPLWEPIEWSLVQSWILFIFLFGWVAENLIVSRYGSYVGRDKRVWMSWFKTFWLIEIFYILNFAVVALFIIVPFYFEINYSVFFIYSWWNWFSRVFFLKFTFLFGIILAIAYFVQRYIQWIHWKNLLLLVTIVNIFLSYLLYTHFIMSFFGYLTNPSWYTNNRSIDYIQLSHEPSRYGWNSAKRRDNFTYHNSPTVVWFKNDGPMASALLLFHLYIFLSMFFVYLYWISLFRRIYSTKEVPLTYVTYCISTLKQLLYCFLALYFFILLSFIFQYWRLPTEFLPSLNTQSWFSNFLNIVIDYPEFIYYTLNPIDSTCRL